MNTPITPTQTRTPTKDKFVVEAVIHDDTIFIRIRNPNTGDYIDIEPLEAWRAATTMAVMAMNAVETNARSKK